ncbi:MAG: hypothetical protein HY770_05735 [Chitinivibrionia bacterium]|nr:hypothetical protein [Chitinivibrionia bacterium]
MKKLLILIPLILLSCAKHNDFPPAVDVAEPPVPADFTVTMPDLGVYELDWHVADSSLVSYYRIYIYSLYTGPEEVDTTSVSEYYTDFGFPVTEVIWGVSSISVENVESKIVYASAAP